MHTGTNYSSSIICLSQILSLYQHGNGVIYSSDFTSGCRILMTDHVVLGGIKICFFPPKLELCVLKIIINELHVSSVD